ncbi:glycerophosphodiester phosphodiesterase [Aureococcus anophagefferens]|nr:glycerophosphodiester phosphodiesterase [Aureococcus anophagefferens]
MVQFGRHLRYVRQRLNARVFLVDYALLCSLVNNEREFTRLWQESLQSATRQHEELADKVWSTVFEGSSDYAAPAEALRRYRAAKGATAAWAVCDRYVEMRAAGDANRDALRKAVKKFDKAGGAARLGPALLPRLYASRIGTVFDGSLEEFREELREPAEAEFSRGSAAALQTAPSWAAMTAVGGSCVRAREVAWLRGTVAAVGRSDARDVLDALVAHRGFHATSDRTDARPVENSLEAYEVAWTSGLALAECDVAVSKDGALVLCHDFGSAARAEAALHGEILLDVDGDTEAAEKAAAGLDGLYVQYQRSMRETPAGSAALRALADRWRVVGVWGDKDRDPDDFVTASHLVSFCGASYVNTDLPKTFVDAALLNRAVVARRRRELGPEPLAPPKPRPAPAAPSSMALSMAQLAKERKAREAKRRAETAPPAAEPRAEQAPKMAPQPSLRAGWFGRSGVAAAQRVSRQIAFPKLSEDATVTVLRRENLGFYREGELVNPIVSPVVLFENWDGKHGMVIGAMLERLLKERVAGAAKGSGRHCMVAQGANCGDTYRVMYSADTPDVAGVESDGSVETLLARLLAEAKAAALDQFPGDDDVRRALYEGECNQDIEAKIHRYAGPGPKDGGTQYMHPHLDAPGAGWVALLSLGATGQFFLCNGLYKDSASFGKLAPISVGESRRKGWPCCEKPWSSNHVYNYRGAWSFDEQCAGKWRPGMSDKLRDCPHCTNLDMKSGTVVLFHGGPEHGNLHGVRGVADEPPAADLRALSEAVSRPDAATRAPTVLGRGRKKKAKTIREQRQRRGVVAGVVAPESRRETKPPSLGARLRGEVAGPFAGAGNSLASPPDKKPRVD